MVQSISQPKTQFLTFKASGPLVLHSTRRLQLVTVQHVAGSAEDAHSSWSCTVHTADCIAC